LSKANRKTITLLCVVAGCFSQIKDRCKEKSPIHKIAQTAYDYTVRVLNEWPLDTSDTSAKVYKKSIEIVGLWETFIQKSEWYLTSLDMSSLCLLSIADSITNDLTDTYTQYKSDKALEFAPIFTFIGKIQRILDSNGVRFGEYDKGNDSVDVLYDLLQKEGWN